VSAFPSTANQSTNLHIDHGTALTSTRGFAGLAIVVRVLAARRTVVLFESGPAGLLSRITDVGRLIHEERVTLVSLVPPLLDRLLQDGFQPPPTLRARRSKTLAFSHSLLSNSGSGL
jgi:hypothetical protein